MVLNKKSGFTLIELLVVISIVGVLASVVLTSVNSARAKARDAKRKQDLHNIQNAMELYYDKCGNYFVRSPACSGAGTGSGGGGQGWFGVQLTPLGSGYDIAVSQGLEAAGFLASSPVNVGDYAQGGYIITLCDANGTQGNSTGAQYAISVYLENPKASETAHVNNLCGSATHLLYSHNYAIP